MDGQWQKPLYLECYFYLFPTVRLLVVRLKRNYKIPIFQVLMLQKCMNKKNNNPNRWMAKTRVPTSIFSCRWNLKRDSSLSKRLCNTKRL